MRKSLYAFVIVTGILTAITAVFPGVIFLAFAIAVPVGNIFSAVPMAFLVSAVFLIGDVALRKCGVIISLLVPAVLLVTICVALPMYWNGPLNADLANLTQGDTARREYKFAAKTVALLVPDPPAWTKAKPTDCIDICQRLLFNGSVSVVLMGSSPFDGNNRVMRYRIERRPTCPSVNIPTFGDWEDEPIPQAVSDNTWSARSVEKRIGAGECLIAEETDISGADIVIAEQVIKQGTNACCRSLQANLDTLNARRLSIYELKDGSRTEIYRQTSFGAQPIFTPLFVSPLGSCRNGSECSLQISIGRKSYWNGRYDLRKFLKTSTDLNVSPLSR